MMEFITLKRLGLDHYNIDMSKSYELFNPDTNNHTIVLYLNKEDMLSNGSMERVNIDIKTLYNISFGSTNFTRIRNRIMYTLNDNSPILGVSKKETNKVKGKPRKKYKKNTNK